MNQWMDKMGLISTNFQGKKIYNGAGMFFAMGTVFIWIIYKFYGLGQDHDLDRLLFLILLIGSVGLIDDMVGKKDFQGFKGHFSQLLQGKFTTGVFKAFISLFVVLIITYKNTVNLEFILNTGLVLLWTNFLNLLDLRPGRTLKFFMFSALILILFVPVFTLYLAPIFLILMIYFPLEMEGRYMLGDTGSNILGAVVGYGFIHWQSAAGRYVLFLLLITFTLLAERYSFSHYISNNRYLNWLDQLGRIN